MTKECERLRNRVAVLQHAVLGVPKTLRHEVLWLVRRDGILLHRRAERVPGLVNWHCICAPGGARRRTAVLELSEGGEAPGPVSFHVVSFLADSELYGKPVARGEPLDVLIRGAETCDADHVRELCEIRVREHWCVAHKLVTDVGLGRVEGP